MGRKGQPAHRGKRMSEAEFRRLWLDRGVSRAEIAAKLGITPDSVRFRARARGLGAKPRPMKLIWTDELAEMWRAGVCGRDIADRHGVAYSTMSRRAAAAGMPPRCTGYRPKLSLAEWREQQFAARLAEVAARETQIERDRRMGIRRAA